MRYSVQSCACLTNAVADASCLLQIEELIRRIQGALPDCPLVGGVLQPEAWGNNPWGGKRSLRGALFMNNKVLDEGAVGCFMKGPLQVSVRCMLAIQTKLTCIDVVCITFFALSLATFVQVYRRLVSRHLVWHAGA